MPGVLRIVSIGAIEWVYTLVLPRLYRQLAACKVSAVSSPFPSVATSVAEQAYTVRLWVRSSGSQRCDSILGAGLPMHRHSGRSLVGGVQNSVCGCEINYPMIEAIVCAVLRFPNNGMEC